MVLPAEIGPKEWAYTHYKIYLLCNGWKSSLLSFLHSVAGLGEGCSPLVWCRGVLRILVLACLVASIVIKPCCCNVSLMSSLHIFLGFPFALKPSANFISLLLLSIFYVFLVFLLSIYFWLSCQVCPVGLVVVFVVCSV
jgi:hypothetical protein